MCVCVCVCVWRYLGSSRSFNHVSLNNKETFCLYNLFKIFKYIIYPVLSNSAFLYFRYGINFQNSFWKIQTHLTQASMKGPKARINFGKLI